jgi:hypothetical protein
LQPWSGQLGRHRGGDLGRQLAQLDDRGRYRVAALPGQRLSARRDPVGEQP